MNTCKDCKFWTFPYQPSEDEWWYQSPPPDKPEAWVKKDVTWGECLKEKIFLGESPGNDECNIGGREEDRNGKTLTGQDFGCVHFESKP